MQKDSKWVEKEMIPVTRIQPTNLTEIVAILTIKDCITTMRIINFLMAQTAILQDTKITTYMVTEEAGSIVAVEGRTPLIIVKLLQTHNDNRGGGSRERCHGNSQGSFRGGQNQRNNGGHNQNGQKPHQNTVQEIDMNMKHDDMSSMSQSCQGYDGEQNFHNDDHLFPPNQRW